MKLFERKRLEKDVPRCFCSAVVPAAGESARMGGISKLFAPLGGMPVLARTLAALNGCPLIDEIVIVVKEADIVAVGGLCAQYGISKASKVVRGGRTRAESALIGVMECSDRAELIAIHDAARPLVSQELLAEVIECARVNGAAAPAAPLADTVKEAENGIVVRTPDRARLFRVQTPQVFETSLIKGALKAAAEKKLELYDDCTAVELLGMKVRLTRGSERNLKLTYPADLLMAGALLEDETD